MNRDDIQSFWGDHLVKLLPERVNSLPLNDVTKQFLVTTGLPRQISLFPDEDLTLTFQIEGVFTAAKTDEVSFIRIGYIGQEEIFLELAEDGSLFSRSAYDASEHRFINSSLEQFLIFVMLYKQLYPEFWLASGIDWDSLDTDEAEEKAAEIAIRFRAQFEPHDPKALEHDETWWSRAMEEMEYGFW